MREMILIAEKYKQQRDKNDIIRKIRISIFMLMIIGKAYDAYDTMNLL